MNLLDQTTRPNELLFYQKNDKSDIRLGEIIKRDEQEFESSEIVIIGSPQDEGVQRNKGRKGAKDAPDTIRSYFYKLAASENISAKNIFDLGNVLIKKTLEETHNLQVEIIFQLLYENKKVMILGGGNDISYPDCRALSKIYKNILAFNIDSDLDVRPDEPRNSGTSYRMLLDEGIISGEDFYEIGIKKYFSSPKHEEFLKRNNSNIISFEEAQAIGISSLLKNILNQNNSDVIFWGFDMDSVREADAPGVSSPCPSGFSAEDALSVAAAAGRDSRTKIFEISEVNPSYDIDGRTSRLAAMMMWEFLDSLS